VFCKGSNHSVLSEPHEGDVWIVLTKGRVIHAVLSNIRGHCTWKQSYVDGVGPGIRGQDETNCSFGIFRVKGKKKDMKNLSCIATLWCLYKVSTQNLCHNFKRPNMLINVEICYITFCLRIFCFMLFNLPASRINKYWIHVDILWRLAQLHFQLISMKLSTFASDMISDSKFFLSQIWKTDKNVGD
jgi:hypothetical protein